METLGDYLRTVRESDGRSLKTISEKTRINLDFLRAMEGNHWDRFSSEVIARGFVRSYALCLGLDEREVLHRFDETVHPYYQQQQDSQAPFREQMIRVKPQIPEKSRTSRILALVVVGVALLALYIIGSIKLQSRMEPSVTVPSVGQEEPYGTDSPEPDSGVTEMPPAPEPAVNVPGGPAKEPAPARPSVSVPAPAPSGGALSVPTPSGLMTLTAEAVETTWIAVRIDDRDTKEVILKPGEKVVWVAEKQFALDVGNAGGVNFKLNGKPLAPFGPSGAVIKNLVLRAEPEEPN